MSDEQLFTGWGPGDPIDDTFLRQFSFSFADQMVAMPRSVGRPVRKEDAWWAADYGVPAGLANGAYLLQPLAVMEDRGAAVLDAIEDHFAAGTGTAMLWSPWPTPDLSSRGWLPFGHPPLLIRPAGGAAPALPDGLRIERVADAGGVADFERTLIEAYPMPEAAHLVPGGVVADAILDEERLPLFVGYVGDEPVGTAAALVDYGHNDVGLVSVHAHHRRKGFGEALTWAATVADPSLPAALLASDDGRPVYERMGYVPILRFTLWGRMRD